MLKSEENEAVAYTHAPALVDAVFEEKLLATFPRRKLHRIDSTLSAQDCMV